MRIQPEERGAIVPMVALLLVVLIPSCAMAVDLGMQRVVRRDVQALADLVALDLVRLVDGRAANQIASGFHGQQTLTTSLARSVARNNDDVLGDAPVVTAVLAHLDPSTGRLDVTAGVTREVTGSEVPNAIEITARGSVDFAFAPGGGAAVQTAVAVPSPSACFRLGSYAAGVDTADAQLLNAILPGLLNNSGVSTTQVGYDGLAHADVSLLDLVGVPSLGVASPDELLEREGLTLGEFYVATASALQSRGGHPAEVTLLQALGAQVNLGNRFAIADILSIATADTAALSADLNVLDLVVAAAQVANGTHAIAVPKLNVPIPGLTNLSTSLTLGESPRLACGPQGVAKAKTAQANLKLSGDLVDVNLPVNLILLSGGLKASTHVDTQVFIAPAEGLLSNIICGDATLPTNAEGIDVDVKADLASTASTTATIRITGTLTLKADLGIVGVIPVAEVMVDLSTNASAPPSAQGTVPQTVSFRHPSDVYGTPESIGSGLMINNVSTPALPAGATVSIRPLNGSGTGPRPISAVSGLAAMLSGLLATAVGQVNGQVLAPLNTVVTPPLAKQLGTEVGGAGVFALPRPSCNDPALAG